MIQFNLLPDVKVQYMKAKKAKHLVVLISVIATATSLALLAIMVSATLFQKQHIKDLDKDIKKYESSISDTKDIAKILTIQNQLRTLPTLYSARPVTSRLFKYVEATTPKEVSLTNVTVDFSTNSLSVEGNADSLVSINRYADTLKFTTFSLDKETASDQNTKAFSGVILSAFNRDDKQASFTLTMNFDLTIFDASKTVTLNVPKTITTRSQTELPTGVFDSKGTN